MKSERIILIVLPIVAVVIGLWLLVISPKRTESADLKDDVATLEAELSDAEAAVAAGETARKSFPKYYADVVALGVAAPADDDQATLVYDLSRLSSDNDLHFDIFQLSDDAGGAEAAAPPPATTTTESTTTETTTEEGESATDTSTSTETETATPAAATPSVATESSAATLPIGATVGSAGLPVMSYSFELSGDFFDATNYLEQLTEDVEVSSDGSRPIAHGRLLTIDGFSFVLENLEEFPKIDANFSVTSYVVPPSQGLEAGATQAGPAPVSGTAPEAGTTTAPQTAAVTP